MAAKQGGAGTRKYGRNKDKCARYKAGHFREKNKVRRVLRASGIEAAREYARLHGISGYLQAIENKRQRPHVAA